MDTETDTTIKNLEADMEIQKERLDDIYESVEKTRKYFLATMIINIVVFVLPLIAAAILIPRFLDSYLGSFSGLGI